MPVIQPIAIASARPEQKKLLEGINAKMGKVPNIYATMAHSPAVLEAMMGYSAGLKKGVLTGKEIEEIALAVGQVNSCDYCLAAHTAMGKMSGLTAEETIEARKGKSRDQKRAALVGLASEIVTTKGRPSSATLNAFRQAGYGDAALVEVIAWVSQNIFTNYFNHIADTQVDFPAAPRLA